MEIEYYGTTKKLWACTGFKRLEFTANVVDMPACNYEARKEVALLSHHLVDQQWTVRHAEEAARDKRLDAIA